MFKKVLIVSGIVIGVFIVGEIATFVFVKYFFNPYKDIKPVNDTEIMSMDKQFQPYFPKILKGDLSLLEIVKRSEGRDSFRLVDTKEGQKSIPVIKGYRGRYGYTGLGYFAKVHVEQTVPDKFQEGKIEAIEALQYIAKNEQNIDKETHRDYEIYSIDNKSLDLGSPIGQTLIFFPEDQIITTIYFINEMPKNRKYQTMEEYLLIKNDFVHQIIDSVDQNRLGQ